MALIRSNLKEASDAIPANGYIENKINSGTSAFETASGSYTDGTAFTVFSSTLYGANVIINVKGKSTLNYSATDITGCCAIKADGTATMFTGSQTSKDISDYDYLIIGVASASSVTALSITIS